MRRKQLTDPDNITNPMTALIMVLILFSLLVYGIIAPMLPAGWVHP